MLVVFVTRHNIMVVTHQDNLPQVRRSREVSGEPGQDSEPGYDLVTFKHLTERKFVTLKSCKTHIRL